eukprot:c12980_g1_i1.p1 GENE.c12980_g1_i1~~c12980_g1_i1.p1  ORF type:complete len:184 (+),score=22.25 c12980_g1_i1:123-674(+)
MPKVKRKGGRAAERLKEQPVAGARAGARQSERIQQLDDDKRPAAIDSRLKQRRLRKRLDALEANNQESRQEIETFVFDERTDDMESMFGAAKVKSSLADKARNEARANNTFRQIFAAHEQKLIADGVAHLPSYFTIVNPPSILPARHLCSMCGAPAPYVCPTCGSRLCRQKCQASHRELRCAQ